MIRLILLLATVAALAAYGLVAAYEDYQVRMNEVATSCKGEVIDTSKGFICNK